MATPRSPWIPPSLLRPGTSGLLELINKNQIKWTKRTQYVPGLILDLIWIKDGVSFGVGEGGAPPPHPIFRQNLELHSSLIRLFDSISIQFWYLVLDSYAASESFHSNSGFQYWPHRDIAWSKNVTGGSPPKISEKIKFFLCSIPQLKSNEAWL